MTYLVPYRGLGELTGLRRGMDDFFSRFFEGGELPVWPAVTGGGEFSPRLDLKETDDGYEVMAEVPGLKPEDIKVDLKGDILTISGEKRDEREETNDNYHLVERTFGRFERTVHLPGEVDRTGIVAKQKDGVLTVTLPKLKGPDTTNITVTN
ncbi:MAG: Hsp20/alpha crystallin family protein [Deltaproteobacteria bacterium]|nr:Hsp20/alpha crystallin family protein [Deltaproteobacteria bacterium]